MTDRAFRSGISTSISSVQRACMMVFAKPTDETVAVSVDVGPVSFKRTTCFPHLRPLVPKHDHTILTDDEFVGCKDLNVGYSANSLKLVRRRLGPSMHVVPRGFRRRKERNSSPHRQPADLAVPRCLPEQMPCKRAAKPEDFRFRSLTTSTVPGVYHVDLLSLRALLPLHGQWNTTRSGKQYREPGDFVYFLCRLRFLRHL